MNFTCSSPARAATAPAAIGAAAPDVFFVLRVLPRAFAAHFGVKRAQSIYTSITQALIEARTHLPMSTAFDVRCRHAVAGAFIRGGGDFQVPAASLRARHKTQSTQVDLLCSTPRTHTHTTETQAANKESRFESIDRATHHEGDTHARALRPALH